MLSNGKKKIDFWSKKSKPNGGHKNLDETAYTRKSSRQLVWSKRSNWLSIF